eukprot:TRINITY_DN2978_c0_g1_i1.p1 TRINITY_DN2978_c0_g1~~TRINITY_DN2978_c0_g1_i1.p1  ORF type:complete len:314 (+),score=120.55 TRINITY_DN2978_c0_g1_i1:96-1037(+)
MHGVKRRTKTKDELEAENQKIERESIAKFVLLSERVEKDKTMLESELSVKELLEKLKNCNDLLELNYELYYVWNQKRMIINQIQKKISSESEDHDLELILNGELNVIQTSIRNNPKSYWTWFHRKWILNQLKNPDWKKEIGLCVKLLSMDERNFHCWGYRRWVSKQMGENLQLEKDFTTQKIDEKFSNYSAWHYRSSVLPQLYGEDLSYLEDELGWVKNAFWTKPQDQSAWFYYRWIIESVMKREDSKQILETEMNELNELIEAEPECKWPLITKLFLISKGAPSDEDSKSILDKLIRLDPMRIGHYNDMLKE